MREASPGPQSWSIRRRGTSEAHRWGPAIVEVTLRVSRELHFYGGLAGTEERVSERSAPRQWQCLAGRRIVWRLRGGPAWVAACDPVVQVGVTDLSAGLASATLGIPPGARNCVPGSPRKSSGERRGCLLLRRVGHEVAWGPEGDRRERERRCTGLDLWQARCPGPLIVSRARASRGPEPLPGLLAVGCWH